MAMKKYVKKTKKSDMKKGSYSYHNKPSGKRMMMKKKTKKKY